MGDSKVTVRTLRDMKARGERITMLTGYDYTFARMLDASGVDAILVGDSLGMVIQGNANTLPVTLDEMVYHCRAVARGVRHAHMIGDMPFLSYQTSVEEAIKSAGRLVKEGGVEAVKLEGGEDFAPTVRALVRCGIPVMAHIGLTPQWVHAMGGFKIQGRDAEAAKRLRRAAAALEEAGAYAVVLEGIPLELAREITEERKIPTIGIGAGPHCDGQVLVLYDLLGLCDEIRPKFVRRYEEFGERGRAAIERYVHEVREGEFPTREHSFSSTAKAAPVARAAEAPANGNGAKPASYGPTQ